MRKELQDLKIHIYEDGKIDDKEVEILRSVLAHYGLGEEEARLLMDLNTILYDHERHPSFDDLLVESITNYVLDDDKVLTREKLDWLNWNVFKDARVDGNERRIFASLEETACNAPGIASLFWVPT